MLRRALGVSLALFALGAPAALAHQGNPNFRSEITDAPPELDATVLDLDDRIEVTAREGHEVVVLGYEDEPYLRYLADGTVEESRTSPATYLNDDRFGDVEVPGAADPDAAPEWSEVAAHDTYDWHDHRIHYMAQGTPPQVEDESIETEVFEWTIPVLVDGRRERISGTLMWVPSSGGPSLAVAAGLATAVLASLAFAIWRIRRRRSAAGSEEAW